MKNLFFMAIVAIFSMLFTVSCTNSHIATGPGVSKTIKTDTTITNHLPLLGDRFDCNGKKLPESKVSGWMIDRTLISQKSPCGFSNDELNKFGYQYVGSEAEEAMSSTSWGNAWWTDFWAFRWSGSFWSDVLKFLAWMVLFAFILTMLLLALGLLRRAWYWMMERMYGSDYSSRSYYYRDCYDNNNYCCGEDRVCIPKDGTYLPPVNPTTGRKVTIMENAAPSQDVLDVLRERGGSMIQAHGEGYHLEVDGPVPPAPVTPPDIYVVKEASGMNDSSAITVNVYPPATPPTAPPAEEKKEDAKKA